MFFTELLRNQFSGLREPVAKQGILPLLGKFRAPACNARSEYTLIDHALRL